LKLYYLFILFIFFIPATFISSQIDEQERKDIERQKVEAIRKKLKIERRKRAIVEKEKGVLKDLQKIDIELDTKEKQLAKLRLQITHWNKQLEKSQKHLAEIKEKFKNYRILASDRIRAMYKLGYKGMKLNSLKFLFGANDLSELLSRYKYINSITQKDRDILLELQSQMDEIESTENEIEENIASIKAAKKEIEKKKVSLIFSKQRREKLLEKYRTEKETYDETLIELETAVAKFREILGEVEKQQTEVYDSVNLDGLSGKMKGKLPLPTQGQIIPNVSQSETGITIKAPKGREIRTIADGVVARVENAIVGYGNTVLIEHGKGYISVYAHTSEISVTEGQKVKKGEVIAEVGDTGSLIGPVLYFELWHGVKRLDTKKWLNIE